MMPEVDTVEVQVHVLKVTDKAVLVAPVQTELPIEKKADQLSIFDDDVTDEDAVWLPRSQIEDGKHLCVERNVSIAIPRWLAEDRGL